VDEWGGESPDGRIEIELVEHEPTRRRSRREFDPTPAPPDAPPAAAEPPVAEPPSRNRLLAIAAGVGAAGLLVGWLAGSAGGGDGVGAAPTGSDAIAATTTPTSFADDPALVEPDEPVLSEPPTTRRRPTTTTQPPVVLEALTGIEPRLLGLPYEIVTLTRTGDLRYINLASGTLATVDGRTSDTVGMLHAGAGWVAVPSGNSGSMAVYHDGNPEPEVVRRIDAWSVRHVPGAPTYWVADNESIGGFGVAMIEVDAYGEPTGASVDVPAHPFGLDSTGAFLVDAPGGAYAVTAAGTSRLTTGIVVAYGPTAAIVYECDEALTCTTLVVDRTTGERREIPGLFADHHPERAGWWGPGGSEAISPDGRWAVLITPVTEPSPDGAGVVIHTWAVTLVDLAGGTTTQLDVGFNWPSGVQWTDDSTFGFLTGADELLVYDARAGEVLPVGAAGSTLQMPAAVAVRPTDGNSWSAS
jgi:hypothetical protein